jgi:serine/threonine protein kinase
MILQVKINLKLNYTFSTRIYGVTRDPQSKEYAIVTKFKNGGNLREVIKKNYSSLTWNRIFSILINISFGLYDIHDKNYYHKDFHSGNILNEIRKDNNCIFPVISDFGLCCPADQNTADKASDIYGFGMLMSEIISGEGREAPFIDRDYDLHLALNICKGERPF